MKTRVYFLLFSLCCLCFSVAFAEKDFLVISDYAGRITTSDPHKQFDEKNIIVWQQVFEGLVRFDPKGKMEPALAVSWERIDDLRVRFYLRRNVKFHNGELFNAKSVKFSIERYLDPKTGFPGISFIDSISYAEIVDDYTIDIITKYPDGLLLNRLAGFVLIVPPKYVKEKGDKYFAKHPIGTGAFKFGEWVKNEKIVLPANENYWMNGYPKVKGLVFLFLHPEKALKPLFGGKIHIIVDLPGTQTHFTREHPKVNIIKEPTFRVLAFSFDYSSKYLSNLKVRKALNYAINKRDLIRYDLLGNGRQIATLSMPGEEGYNPCLKPYKYNPAKAKKLLTEAGFPNGFTLKVATRKASERSARIIAVQLKKVGVVLDIFPLSIDELMTSAKSGYYDMQLGDNPDPMCHSYFNQYIKFFSKSPFSLWKDAVFDKMLLDMASTIDDKQRNKKARDIDTYIYENALSIFTYQKMSVIAVNEDVHFEPYITGMPHLFKSYLKRNTSNEKYKNKQS